MRLKFQPVAWMTGTLAVLSTLLAVDEQFHVLPEGWTKWLLLASAAITILLGKLTHGVVTPLVDPRAANGRRLVPTPPARVPPGTAESSLDADRP